MSPDPVTTTPEKQAELLARLAELEAENAAIKAANVKSVSFKVGPSGGVSVYGLCRNYPVTLYVWEWEKLFEALPGLKAFIVTHSASLKTSRNGNGK